MTAWILLALAAWLPLASDDAVVARVAGHELHASELGAWMVQRMGYSHVDDYVNEYLILTEAAQLGLVPDQAEIDAHLEQELQELAERFFGGDRQAWTEDLLRRGIDPEGFRSRRRHELAAELSLEALARHARQVGESQIQQLYHARYGELNERVSVQVLFYDDYAHLEPGAPRPELTQLDGLARSRAQAARAAWLEGQPFANLLAQSDKLASEFVVDGVIAGWRPNLLGPEAESAVSSLDEPGDLSPPVKVWNGYYLIRLVERRRVSLELLHDELRQELLERPATSEEHNNVRARLREKYAPEVLLR